MSIENSYIPPNPHSLNSVIGESNETLNELQKQVEGLERIGLHSNGHDTQENEEITNEQDIQTQKRKKTSGVWTDFHMVNIGGVQKLQCNHCGHQFQFTKTGTTTSYKRHQDKCAKRKLNLRVVDQQTKLNFMPSDGVSSSIPPLHPGKFDMELMREYAANWIMMHEHPFTILEEVGFNLMMKQGWPEWKKIEYMVVTGHWIDSSWRLQKRVLSFINIPPPSRGLQLSDAIFGCMKEWGIEKKVFTITVDNASSNDSVIRYMKDTLQRSRSLVCGGRFFHVRCCAHILNLCVQDGLDKIQHVISDVRDSVEYVNRSETRRIQFANCVQQLQLKDRKLIRDFKTRWNSTFEMLSCALKFKEAFKMLKDRDPFFDSCPLEDDWDKVAKVCSILEAFWTATHIISGLCVLIFF
nr:zinc finger BED domain-containing protein RICESLEEPER 2-like [Ipomoea batatas]